MNVDVSAGRPSRYRAGRSGRYVVSPEKRLFLSDAGSWRASWPANEQEQWRRILGWQTPAPKEEEQSPPRRLPVREDMTTAFVEELCRALADYVGPGPVDAELEPKFNSLVAQWKPAVEAMSSVTTMVLHPAYQQIIALGPRAIPLLLRELDRELDHWFWALRVLTRENPVPAGIRGNMGAMREAWLAWGKSEGYRW